MTGRQPCASAPACYNLLSIKDRGGPILPDNESQRYCFQAMPLGKLQHLALVTILRAIIICVVVAEASRSPPHKNKRLTLS